MGVNIGEAMAKLRQEVADNRRNHGSLDLGNIPLGTLRTFREKLNEVIYDRERESSTSEGGSREAYNRTLRKLAADKLIRG